MARKVKIAPAPSHEERWNRANAKAAIAVATFEGAIVSLDESASEHAELADELESEMARLAALRDKALYDYDAATDVSDRLRALVGSEQPR